MFIYTHTHIYMYVYNHIHIPVFHAYMCARACVRALKAPPVSAGRIAAPAELRTSLPGVPPAPREEHKHLRRRRNGPAARLLVSGKHYGLTRLCNVRREIGHIHKHTTRTTSHNGIDIDGIYNIYRGRNKEREVCIYTYIYIERERKRERDVYIYIYIYMYGVPPAPREEHEHLRRRRNGPAARLFVSGKHSGLNVHCAPSKLAQVPARSEFTHSGSLVAAGHL